MAAHIARFQTDDSLLGECDPWAGMEFHTPLGPGRAAYRPDGPLPKEFPGVSAEILQYLVPGFLELYNSIVSRERHADFLLLFVVHPMALSVLKTSYVVFFMYTVAEAFTENWLLGHAPRVTWPQALAVQCFLFVVFVLLFLVLKFFAFFFVTFKYSYDLKKAAEAAERLWTLMSTGTAFDQGLRHLCFQVIFI